MSILCDAIGFVCDEHCVLAIDPEFLQDARDGTNLFEHRGVTGVRDVQQQVGLSCLFQSRFKTCDQSVGQVSNEAHGIAQQNGPPTGQLPATGTRIKGGEQFILRQHAGCGERVHQCALTRIRVTYQ